MPGQTDEELMRLLNFDTDDLRRNQQGQISLQQRVRLFERKGDFMPLFFLGAGVVGFVIWFGKQPPDQMIVLVVIILLALLMSRSSFKVIADVLFGAVAETSGAIEIQVYAQKEDAFFAMLKQKPPNYGVAKVNDLIFYVPPELATRFQGKPLRIFYSPRSRMVLSAQSLVQ